jgi:stage II sporulation protein D
VFHPSSAGKTEAASAVWSSDLPYLVSVDSPETSADVPNYVSSVTVTTQEFKDTILAAHPDAVFPDDTTQWLSDIEYTDSDRIHTLRIGGTTVTGSELRSMFSLRSTAISFDISESAITMTSTGYGHGVGMSQYGANVLAESGSTFDEILALYYPGTVLSVLEL